MENPICLSLLSDLMLYWAVGADGLLFKRYGFMDLLSVCWTSAVTWRSTLSEQGSSDGSSLSRHNLWIVSPHPFSLRRAFPNHLPTSDSSCPHFHPNFSSNDNTPNNSHNPSMPHCSITVFRRMGLGVEVVVVVGGWWNELSWRVMGGVGGEEKDKGEERLLFTAMKGCRWRDRHSSSG